MMSETQISRHETPFPINRRIEECVLDVEEFFHEKDLQPEHGAFTYVRPSQAGSEFPATIYEVTIDNNRLRFYKINHQPAAEDTRPYPIFAIEPHPLPETDDLDKESVESEFGTFWQAVELSDGTVDSFLYTAEEPYSIDNPGIIRESLEPVEIARDVVDKLVHRHIW